MAKILTSDELANKFLDNAKQHIGMTTPTLAKIKEAIDKYWGYDLATSNRCVYHDYYAMASQPSTKGEFWNNSGSACNVNMLNFWNYVYGVTASRPTSETDYAQITQTNADFSLLPEDKVDVKGTMINTYNKFNGKCNVTSLFTNGYSLNSLTVSYFSEENSVEPLIRYVGSSDSFLPNTTFIKENANTNITVFISVGLNKVYSTLSNLTVKFGNKTFTLGDKLGEYFTTTLNEITSVTEITVSGSVSPSITYTTLDISNCYIQMITATTTTSFNKTNMNIFSGVTYANGPSTAFLCSTVNEFTGGTEYDIILKNNGKTIQFTSQLTTTGNKYLWVALDSIFFCFQVNISSTTSISLTTNECYIELTLYSNYNNFPAKIQASGTTGVIGIGYVPGGTLKTLGNTTTTKNIKDVIGTNVLINKLQFKNMSKAQAGTKIYWMDEAGVRHQFGTTPTGTAIKTLPILPISSYPNMASLLSEVDAGREFRIIITNR